MEVVIIERKVKHGVTIYDYQQAASFNFYIFLYKLLDFSNLFFIRRREAQKFDSFVLGFSLSLSLEKYNFQANNGYLHRIFSLRCLFLHYKLQR